jgi:hypothetical protein
VLGGPDYSRYEYGFELAEHHDEPERATPGLPTVVRSPSLTTRAAGPPPPSRRGASSYPISHRRIQLVRPDYPRRR